MRSTLTKLATVGALSIALMSVSAAPAAAYPRLTATCGPTYVWSGAAYGAHNTWNPGNYIVGALWPPQTFDLDGRVWGVTMLSGFAFGAVNRFGYVYYGCLS